MGEGEAVSLAESTRPAAEDVARRGETRPAGRDPAIRRGDGGCGGGGRWSAAQREGDVPAHPDLAYRGDGWVSWQV